MAEKKKHVGIKPSSKRGKHLVKVMICLLSDVFLHRYKPGNADIQPVESATQDFQKGGGWGQEI